MAGSGYVAQGDVYTDDAYFMAYPGGPAEDPDAGTLLLTIKNAAGDTIITADQADMTHLATGHYEYEWAVPADLDPGPYTWDWDADINGTAAAEGSVVQVIVIPAGSITTTVTPLGAVRALVDSALTDEQLVAVVARAESLLAQLIGPLTGPRTQLFTIASFDSRRTLALRRTTDAVTLTVDTTASTDFRLADDGRTVVPLATTGWALGSWSGPVVATYTPNDLDLVQQAVIDVVRDLLTQSTFASESIGDYSYTRGSGQTSVRSVAYRYGLLPRAVPTSIRITSVRPSWVGTTRP